MVFRNADTPFIARYRVSPPRPGSFLWSFPGLGAINSRLKTIRAFQIGRQNRPRSGYPYGRPYCFSLAPAALVALWLPRAGDDLRTARGRQGGCSCAFCQTKARLAR